MIDPTLQKKLLQVARAASEYEHVAPSYCDPMDDRARKLEKLRHALNVLGPDVRQLLEMIET